MQLLLRLWKMSANTLRLLWCRWVLSSLLWLWLFAIIIVCIFILDIATEWSAMYWDVHLRGRSAEPSRVLSLPSSAEQRGEISALLHNVHAACYSCFHFLCMYMRIVSGCAWSPLYDLAWRRHAVLFWRGGGYEAGLWVGGCVTCMHSPIHIQCYVLKHSISTHNYTRIM